MNDAKAFQITAEISNNKDVTNYFADIFNTIKSININVI
jgi:hypothetical protein